MKLLLGGGGSGGHIFPALAVASALRDHINEDLDLLYVGTETGVESRIVPEAGIPFKVVASRRVRGRHALSKAWSLATMGVGVWDAVRIIRRFRPNAVLLTGGYASVPVGLAAWLTRRPIVVFQPDIEPGWAIRLLTRIATKVCVTEAQSLHRLPANKGTATGYPLRPVFNDIDRPMARARFGLNGTPSILVSGSIQGAHQINAAIDDNLEEWVTFAQLIHVTGEKDARHMAQRREDLPEELRHRYQPIEYLGDELPTAMAACDLAISRAGASVLAEYPAAGLASVLIPLPGAGGHQRHNAQALTDAGAAIVIDDSKVGAELLGTTRAILEDSERLAEMRRRSAAKARVDAAERIAEVLWEVRRD